MKKLTVLALFLVAACNMLAQETSSTTRKAAGATGKHKKEEPAVAGFIRDAHRHPITDVQAFIYARDSSIIASGYTDASGRFETNAVLPGTYTVKIVYPSTKVILVSGVVIKKGYAPLNITAEPPAADTSLPYTYFAPAPEKSKTGAGGNKKK